MLQAATYYPKLCSNKVFLIYAMMAYRRSRDVAPLILNLNPRWMYVVNFTH